MHRPSRSSYERLKKESSRIVFNQTHSPRNHDGNGQANCRLGQTPAIAGTKAPRMGLGFPTTSSRGVLGRSSSGTDLLNQDEFRQPEFYADLKRLVQDLKSISDLLTKYCELRARDKITSVTCLRIQRDVNQLKSSAQRKNDLLQDLLSCQITNFDEEDVELRTRIEFLRDVNLILESMQSVIECASTVRCADFTTSVDDLVTRLYGTITPCNDTMMNVVMPTWSTRDQDVDMHINSVMLGVQNLETIAIAIREKNNRMGEVIQFNSVEADQVLTELDQLETKMRWVRKLLSRSRFWCYLGMMTVIMLLSTSLGFLLKARFTGSSSSPRPSQIPAVTDTVVDTPVQL